MLRPDLCPGPVVAVLRRLGAWLGDLVVELIRIDMEE